MALTKVTSGLISADASSVDLNIDAGTLYIDATNNRVGVGTTSPSVDLHVSGGNPVIYIQDSNNTAAQTGLVSVIQGFDSASTKIWGFGRKFGSTALQIENDQASSIIFNQGGSEIARFDGSGQLGVGTSSPSHLLEISDTTPTFRINNTGGVNNYLDINYGSKNTNDISFTSRRGGSGSGFVFGTEPGGTYSALMKITSGGSLGLGTTTPDTIMEIVDADPILTIRDTETSTTNAISTLRLGETGGSDTLGSYWDIVAKEANWQLVFSRDGTEHARFDNSGNLGLGTNDPDEQLHIHHASTDNYIQMTVGNTTSSNNIQFGDSDGNNRGKISYANTGDSMRFYTNGASNERMRIDSGGNVLFGKTSASASITGIHINNNGVQISVVNFTSAGTAKVFNNNNATGSTYKIEYRQNNSAVGNISVGSSSTSYNTTSDYRLKENIQPLANGLERVQQLNPVQFDWKESGETSEGFIAHEVQEIFNDAVSGEKDGKDMQGMDYGRITPLLVKAIQEQQVLIEQLQAEVALLKGE